MILLIPFQRLNKINNQDALIQQMDSVRCMVNLFYTYLAIGISAFEKLEALNEP